MNDSESIVYKGFWWLPDNPDDKVPGILTYTPSKDIVLELIGSFNNGGLRQFFESINNSGIVTDLILGIDSKAKEISLIRCNYALSYYFSSSFPIVKYKVDIMVYDKHILSADEVYPYTAFVKIPELTYWALPGAIHIEMDSDANDSIISTAVSIKKMDDQSETIQKVCCENGVVLSIKRNAQYKSSHLDIKPDIEQYTYLEICKQGGLSIKDILHEVYKFERFLSLATMRNVQYSEIYLNDPEIVQDNGKGKNYLFPINIYKIRSSANNPYSINRNEFLFRFEDIAKDAHHLIFQWMSDVDNMRPIKNYLVDSIVYKRSFSSVDFLVVIQAIEGFWWRFRENNYSKSKSKDRTTTLKTILNELINEFSCIKSLSLSGDDIGATVDSRHYYSHFMDKSEKPKTLDGWELYDLTGKIRKLLFCCVMKFIGLDEDSINQILTKQQSS